MRTIDADTLKRKVQRLATEAWKMQVKASAETILNQFIDYIDHAPTVDAVTVRHGHWVKWYEEVCDSFGVAYVPHCKCSECGREYDPYNANHMNYCSNCGVKLDGKDGDRNG